MNIRYLAIPLLFLTKLHTSYAAEVTPGQFYRSSTGSVAFIPFASSQDAAKSATSYELLGDSGSYQLRDQSDYWFVVNHKVSTATEITYLGIEVIKVLDTPVRAPLHLRRNKNWTRPNDPDFDGAVADRVTISEKQLTDFYELHEVATAVDDLDESLNFKWHAIPVGSSENSWDKRTRWLPTFDVDTNEFHQNFDPPVADNAPLMLNAQLLRFSTTNKVRSLNPVVFNFDGTNVVAAYVKIFSPDAPEFDRVYYLSFQ